MDSKILSNSSRSGGAGAKGLLFGMMFTVYFILGTSMLTLGLYMNAAGMRHHLVYAASAFPLSMIVAPLFFGFVADRYLPANKMIGGLFLAAGAALLAAAAFGGSPPLFVGFFFLHMLVFTPSLGLANTIAMAHVSDRARFFPIIRAGGTFGWITAAAIISLLKAEGTLTPFAVSGALAMVSGLACFAGLPHTEPAGKNKAFRLRDAVGADAVSRLNQKGNGFKVLLFSAFFATMLANLYDQYAPLYFNNAGIDRTAAFMSIGQVSEILVMTALPFLASRFNLKTLMAAGLFAAVTRYALLLASTYIPGPALALAAITVHGLIVVLFVIASQMVMDMMAAPEIRAQAQSLMMFVSMGAGTLLGALAMGHVLNIFISDVRDLSQWRVFWVLPLSAAVLTALVFSFGFKNDKLAKAETA